MYKQFLVLLLAMVLLSACSGAANNESMNESGRNQWTETETSGNHVITREYRDGENDYTVTEEVYNHSGALQYKTAKLYTQKTLLEETRTDYEDGNVISTTTTKYDANGVIICIEDMYVGETYVTYRNVAYKNGEKRDTDVRYESLDGEKMASGTEQKITEEGLLCDESVLEVYNTSGNVHHIERRVLAEDGTYRRYEFCSADGELLFSLTDKDDIVTYLLSGENGGTVEYRWERYYFYDTEGKQFANASLVGSEMVVHQVHGFYNDMVRYMQSLLDQITEYMEAFPMGMIYSGKTWE